MQASHELTNKYFPSIKKSLNVSNIFEIIKIKKDELTKQIELIQKPENTILPTLSKQALPSKHLGSKSDQEQKFGKIKHSIRKYNRSNGLTEPNLYEKYKQNQQKGEKSEGITPKSSLLTNKQKFQHKQHFQSRNKLINRIKTQISPNDQQRLENVESSRTKKQIFQKTEIQKHQLRQIQNAKSSFRDCSLNIPKSVAEKNQTTLSQPIQLLQSFNPFFNRMPNLLSICLLKMGKIRHYEAHKIVYKVSDNPNYFYIILLGKIKITNGQGFKKICHTGETILQQIIFTQKNAKISQQKAKSMSDSILLEIRLQSLKKIMEELVRSGFKLQFHEMEAIIKRNFIIKNWLRNKGKNNAKSIF